MLTGELVVTYILLQPYLQTEVPIFICLFLDTGRTSPIRNLRFLSILYQYIIHQDLITPLVLKQESFLLEDLIVYVDPIDATREFTLGNREAPMTLIGFSSIPSSFSLSLHLMLFVLRKSFDVPYCSLCVYCKNSEGNIGGSRRHHPSRDEEEESREKSIFLKIRRIPHQGKQ
eukprot:TRINITY_DN2879_c0_g1_i6.p1 TRINITY_DN2879_c0_g1~~TRINITY_DN2879_c0_g1_i6.p1  ORF type:complete len:173 (+),score=9.99 TRINITY_DN2879_c0_g1_i6:213-731(+)